MKSAARLALVAAAALWVSGVGASNAVVPPAHRCRTADLHVYLSRFGAAAGSVAGDVVFRNQTRHLCFVYGYAGFGLEDAHHRVKRSRVTWGSTVARRDPGPHQVILSPGHAAFANLSYSDVPHGRERCRPSAWLEVTPPDERTHRLVPFRGLVCDHGHLTATALSGTRTPRG
jgi:hypothetical protein